MKMSLSATATDFFSCLGHLWWRDTDLIISIYVAQRGQGKYSGGCHMLLSLLFCHKKLCQWKHDLNKGDSRLKWRKFKRRYQGSHTEEEESVQLTPLNLLVYINSFLYWKHYLPFLQNKLP
jgi:hypothetical protein